MMEEEVTAKDTRIQIENEHLESKRNATDTSEDDKATKPPDFDYEKKDISRYAISGDVPELCCCYDHKVGRLYVMSSSSMKWMVGPCWPMIFVTSALIGTIPAIICIFVLIKLSFIVVIVVGLITGFTLLTFWATACQNPGVFPRHYHIPRDTTKKWMYSGQSNSYRPPGVRYCSECQVQIKHIDHFCPWTGTTIGADNFQCFKLFTSSLCLLILVVILFVIIQIST